MKKIIFATSLIVTSLIISTAIAAQASLVEKLDEEGAKRALKAIHKEYKIDFKEFTDVQSATNVHNYLDFILEKKAHKWYGKLADIKSQSPVQWCYEKYAHYIRLRADQNASWSLYLRPAHENSSTSTIASSHSEDQDLVPSPAIAPQDKLLTTLLKRLDEEGTKKVLSAINNKYQVKWSFSDKWQDMHIHNYLAVILSMKMSNYEEVFNNIIYQNPTSYAHNPLYQVSHKKFLKYYEMQNTMSYSWFKHQ